jgi:hypothetical protein
MPMCTGTPRHCVYKEHHAIVYREHQRHCALQRQNTEISKQIFPEKEYRVSVPIFTFMRL